MTTIRFLKQEDLTHIEEELKRTLNTESITLERGFIFYPFPEPCCYLIVKDAKQRRYKIEAVTQSYKLNGKDPLMPYLIWKTHPYKQNFAFNTRQEFEIYEKLTMEYILGRIDGTGYLEAMRLATTSKKELVDKVKQNYERITGICAAIMGFLGASALYKISEYTPAPINDYVDFWKFALSAGWLTGIMRSSIPALSIVREVKKMKGEMVKELTDIIRGEESGPKKEL